LSGKPGFPYIMRVMFIEAKRKSDLNIDKINLKILPDKIFLAYSVQYKNLAEKLKKKLGTRITGFKQILGCSKLKTKHPILLIGSGKFHAIQLALQNNTVYILEGDNINKLATKEVEKIKLKRKASISKFLAAEKIGILVSTKPGQENLKSALKLRKKLEKKEKEVVIFLADNINLEELENYNIDSWINTACPALTFDSRVINISTVHKVAFCP